MIWQRLYVAVLPVVKDLQAWISKGGQDRHEAAITVRRCSKTILFGLELITLYSRLGSWKILDGAESRQRSTGEPISEEMTVLTQAYCDVLCQLQAQSPDKDLVFTIFLGKMFVLFIFWQWCLLN